MSEIQRYTASSRRRLFVLVLSFAVLASLWACSFDTPGGKEVIVAAETIRLRSSTAEAARTVGELKIGERATIKEQEDEGSTTWVRIVGPNDQKGWTEMSNLLDVGTAEKSRKLAEEIRSIQTQAVGRSRASLKLRLTPDRSNEDNVLVLLPSGTLLDIVGRDRKPRPEKTDQKEGDESAQAGQSGQSGSSGQTAQTSPSPKAGQTPPKGQNGQPSQNVRYDDWLNVRLPSNPVTPAGWIYGGSVELEYRVRLFTTRRPEDESWAG